MCERERGRGRARGSEREQGRARVAEREGCLALRALARAKTWIAWPRHATDNSERVIEPSGAESEGLCGPDGPHPFGAALWALTRLRA